MKKFIPLAVSSKFGLCGLPLRADTYKTCSHGCKYCFSNDRKIMEFEKTLAIANIDYVKNKLNKIFNKKDYKKDNFLDSLIANKITWHCGGMSDPFQPSEKRFKCTEDLLNITNDYDISILFSTKGFNTYGASLLPNLHTFQLSITNVYNRTDIEPNVADIETRLKFFNSLKDKGFKVGIRVQPFIPNVTDIKIVEMFKYADYFTSEGLKLVPQNKKHKQYLINLLNLNREDFTQMGLLNLKPEIRERLYKPFISILNEYNIPYSLADNDMHHISSSTCCCGDVLIKKSTSFHTTNMVKKYGSNYTKDDLKIELKNSGFKECIAKNLFTSNRQEGLNTVEDFLLKRYDRKTSPFSPKFLTCNKCATCKKDKKDKKGKKGK